MRHDRVRILWPFKWQASLSAWFGSRSGGRDADNGASVMKGWTGDLPEPNARSCSANELKSRGEKSNNGGMNLKKFYGEQSFS